jgi:hypothetical protein
MFEEQINRGIDLLDAYGLEDWREKALSNLDRLNMYDTTNCLLGIVYGQYGLGLQALTGQLAGCGAPDCGFNIRSTWDEEYDEIMSKYAILTEEWKKALR